MRRVTRADTSGPARFRAGLLASLLIVAGGVSAQQSLVDGADAAPGTVYVELQGDLVTLRAHDAPLRDILAGIARQGNLSIESLSPLQKRISVEFEKLPLPQALVRIMRGESYLLHRTRTGPDERSASHASTDTLWVFADESGDRTGFSFTSASMAIESLRTQLASDDVRTRLEAIKRLRKLKIDEAVEPLGAALSDEERAIRVKAIYALADIGGEDAVAVLATALSDDNPWVRSETAYALGAIGDDSAIPILKHALYDADSRVRTAAISAFTEIGGAHLADALTIALQDTDPAVRVEAVESIWNIGGETAMLLLNKALQDSDDAVREAAREGLAMLSPRDS